MPVTRQGRRERLHALEPQVLGGKPRVRSRAVDDRLPRQLQDVGFEALIPAPVQGFAGRQHHRLARTDLKPRPAGLNVEHAAGGHDEHRVAHGPGAAAGGDPIAQAPESDTLRGSPGDREPQPACGCRRLEPDVAIELAEHLLGEGGIAGRERVPYRGADSRRHASTHRSSGRAVGGHRSASCVLIAVTRHTHGARTPAVDLFLPRHDNPENDAQVRQAQRRSGGLRPAGASAVFRLLDNQGHNASLTVLRRAQHHGQPKSSWTTSR